MDKKVLRQIPRPVAKPEYIELARNVEQSRWLLHVSESDGILQVSAWSALDMRKEGTTQAKYRFFLSEDIHPIRPS